jgi:hypothetical protein
MLINYQMYQGPDNIRVADAKTKIPVPGGVKPTAAQTVPAPNQAGTVVVPAGRAGKIDVPAGTAGPSIQVTSDPNSATLRSQDNYNIDFVTRDYRIVTQTKEKFLGITIKTTYDIDKAEAYFRKYINKLGNYTGNIPSGTRLYDKFKASGGIIPADALGTPLPGVPAQLANTPPEETVNPRVIAMPNAGLRTGL